MCPAWRAEEAGMVWHIAEWAGTVLAAWLITGLVVAAVGAAALWLAYRRARRRVEAFTSTVARYALQSVSGAAAGRGRVPPRVVPDLRQRTAPPAKW
jgi:hypothetical protein